MTSTRDAQATKTEKSEPTVGGDEPANHTGRLRGRGATAIARRTWKNKEAEKQPGHHEKQTHKTENIQKNGTTCRLRKRDHKAGEHPDHRRTRSPIAKLQDRSRSTGTRASSEKSKRHTDAKGEDNRGKRAA